MKNPLPLRIASSLHIGITRKLLASTSNNLKAALFYRSFEIQRSIFENMSWTARSLGLQDKNTFGASFAAGQFNMDCGQTPQTENILEDGQISRDGKFRRAGRKVKVCSKCGFQDVYA